MSSDTECTAPRSHHRACRFHNYGKTGTEVGRPEEPGGRSAVWHSLAPQHTAPCTTHTARYMYKRYFIAVETVISKTPCVRVRSLPLPNLLSDLRPRQDTSREPDLTIRVTRVEHGHLASHATHRRRAARASTTAKARNQENHEPLPSMRLMTRSGE